MYLEIYEATNMWTFIVNNKVGTSWVAEFKLVFALTFQWEVTWYILTFSEKWSNKERGWVYKSSLKFQSYRWISLYGIIHAGRIQQANLSIPGKSFRCLSDFPTPRKNLDQEFHQNSCPGHSLKGLQAKSLICIPGIFGMYGVILSLASWSSLLC